MKHIMIDNEYDGRIHKNFKAVSEREEILLTSVLSDYFVWYNKNKEIINEQIKELNLEVNSKTIAQYWLNNIAKSDEVIDLIENIEVLADIFAYTEKYLEKISALKTSPVNKVLFIKDYRNKKQADRIREIFENHSENSKVKEVMDYLNRKNLGINDLNTNQASRIIVTCEKSIYSKGGQYEH